MTSQSPFWWFLVMNLQPDATKQATDSTQKKKDKAAQYFVNLGASLRFRVRKPAN